MIYTTFIKYWLIVEEAYKYSNNLTQAFDECIANVLIGINSLLNHESLL